MQSLQNYKHLMKVSSFWMSLDELFSALMAVNSVQRKCTFTLLAITDADIEYDCSKDLLFAWPSIVPKNVWADCYNRFKIEQKRIDNAALFDGFNLAF